MVTKISVWIADQLSKPETAALVSALIAWAATWLRAREKFNRKRLRRRQDPPSSDDQGK